MVNGVISEDIDTLVFGADRIIKRFNREHIANEIALSEVLSGLGLSYDQFIDFCILCGCDYTAKINGIGPVKALKLIKQKQNIEGVIDFLREDNKLRARHPIPDDFNYLIARRLFLKPEVTEICEEDIKQCEFKEKELKEFLLERDFNEKRVDNWIEKARSFDLKNAS